MSRRDRRRARHRPQLHPGFGAYIMLKPSPVTQRRNRSSPSRSPVWERWYPGHLGLATLAGTDTKLGRLAGVVAGHSFFFKPINMIPYSPLDGGRLLVPSPNGSCGRAGDAGRGHRHWLPEPIFLILILFPPGAPREPLPDTQRTRPIFHLASGSGAHRRRYIAILAVSWWAVIAAGPFHRERPGRRRLR